MAPWPGPVGYEPCSGWKGLTRWKPGVCVSMPTPKAGPLPELIVLPLRSMKRAFSSVMSPAATATPGTRATWACVDAGIEGPLWLLSVLVSNVVLAVTTAAVPS